MKRAVVVTMLVLGVLVLEVAEATEAGADKFARVHFGTTSVTLTLPTPDPACRTTHGTTSCQWTLVVVEKERRTDTGDASGVSGVLTVPYPPYCGDITADIVVGPPYRTEVGFNHSIATQCPSPPAAAGADPAAGQGQGSPAQTQAVQDQPATFQVDADPSAATTTSSPSSSSTGGLLPYTGAPIPDMLVAGIACLLLAALCLRRPKRRKPTLTAFSVLGEPISKAA